VTLPACDTHANPLHPLRPPNQRYHPTVRLRAWLRDQVVNREGGLGPVRTALLRFLDPMEWYMRKEDVREAGGSRRSRDWRHGGWVAYAPREETPSQAARPGVRAAEEVEPAESRRHRQLLVEHAGLLEDRARDMLAGNAAVVETSGGTIRAQLVRFRSGAVIESWSESPGSTGHAMMHGTGRPARCRLSPHELPGVAARESRPGCPTAWLSRPAITCGTRQGMLS
jgi:hypothetical protein